ncbi:MAG: peptidylprolyl isomerase [Prevotella sp.]|nr:peptidylprolyl isomerase [Prevotella sp.]
MKAKLLLGALLMMSSMAFAQSDPTIMTVNGQPVSRSEFEYSYNKNNAEGVVDKKSIEEYVDLFINYKLKVQAAIDAGMDTLTSFKKEFAGYRDQQIRPAMINDDDVEREARSIYEETRQRIDSMGGLIKPAHILVMARQTAPEAEQQQAKLRIDSIYNALQAGADFAELAKTHSQDPGSAKEGGELPWCQKGQLVKEFEDAAFALKVGETSKPVQSPYGWHIIKMVDKQNFFPYDSVRTDIRRFIDSRGIRNKIIDEKLQQIATDRGTTPEAVLAEKTAEMTAADSDLAYLIKEYHDGLLLYEISNQTVWEKASKDEAALEQYFKKHKKDFKWDEPRFKGMSYHTKEAADVKNVQKAVKGVAYDKWGEVLRQTFNNDSTLRIRVKIGIFKAGDDGLVDSLQFKKADAKVKAVKDFPYDGTYGKMLKAPQSYTDVKNAVISNYQEELEKQWVADLRKRYPVVVNKDVVNTVNNH